MERAGSPAFPGSSTRPSTPESLSREKRQARKAARKQEIFDAIKTCKIHLSDREMKLMTREVDEDFLRQEAEAQAEFERQKRARRRNASPRSGSPTLLGASIARDSLLTDTGKAKLEDANYQIKRQSSDVKILRSALTDLQQEQTIPLTGALHPKNRRHKALMNRTRAPAAGTNVATSTEAERQQLLVAKAIARVKARQKTADNRLKECYNVAIALSGREPGSPKATDRHITDSEELQLIFKEVDEDNSGYALHAIFLLTAGQLCIGVLFELPFKVDIAWIRYLDKAEVGVLCERLGKQISTHEIDSVMRIIDEDGSGAVNVIEFEEYWRNHIEAKAAPGTLPEANSRAYRHFACEYKPICERVRLEDALLIRAAGGTDAVVRYAWKTQSANQKRRWANSARTVALRQETQDLQRHGLTRFNTTYDRAPAAHIEMQANWRHRGMVGLGGNQEVMVSPAQLRQVADPNNFLRGTSPYRVAVKEGSHEGPTQGYPQEITDALNSTVTSVESVTSSLPDLAQSQPHVNAASGIEGLDTTVNAGRLGSVLVDVADRGMDLFDMNNTKQDTHIFASPASSFASPAQRQQKSTRFGPQSENAGVFASTSMPELPTASSASALRARMQRVSRDSSEGTSAFARSGELCRPAPALLRGRPMALRMVPSSLRREQLRKQPTTRPYSFVVNHTNSNQERRFASPRNAAHWSEETFDPSNVSVSYV